MRRLLIPGLRFLIRRPGFALPAVLTLAAGLGAATAAFTLLDTVLLRPLPYPGGERIVGFWGQGSWSRGELEFLRDNLTSYAAVGAFTTDEVTLHGAAEGAAPRVVPVAVASHDVFDALATAPARGRALRLEDEAPGSRVVVVSDAFWQRELGADPGAVGRVLHVDDEAYEVVGVMPAGF
jgi:putative ABC transport system permease protein